MKCVYHVCGVNDHIYKLFHMAILVRCVFVFVLTSINTTDVTGLNLYLGPDFNWLPGLIACGVNPVFSKREHCELELFAIDRMFGEPRSFNDN